MTILSVIVGLWFIGIGAYSFYYAAVTMKTGDVKAGWIVSKNIQLTNCKDPKAFIEAIYKKTNMFATAAISGGLGMMIGSAINMVALQMISMIELIAFYIWYSSSIKNAQKRYLSPSFKAKANKKL